MDLKDVQQILRYASKWNVNNVFAFERINREEKLVIKRNKLKFEERDSENYDEFYIELWKSQNNHFPCFLYFDGWDLSDLPEEYMQYLLYNTWEIGDHDDIYV